MVQVATAEQSTAQSLPVFLAPLARPTLPGTHVYLFQNSLLGFAASGTERYRALPAGNALNALGNAERCYDSAESFAVVGNNPLSYTDPSGTGFWSNFLSFLVGFFGGNIYPSIGGGFPNIGGVNSGPWNEQIPYSIGGGGALNTGGIYGDGSAGPFIFDYTSVNHWDMTRAAGGSIFQAAWVVAVDFWLGSQDQNHASWHAMGGVARRRDDLGGRVVPQTCGQAYKSSVATLRALSPRAQGGDSGAAAVAEHEIQDSYAGGHGYQYWPGGLLPSREHHAADKLYSEGPVDATRRYQQALRGAAPMGNPESYLAPKPAACQ